MVIEDFLLQDLTMEQHTCIFRNADSLNSSKKHLKTYLIRQAFLICKYISI